MVKNNINRVMVTTSGNKPAGIITQKDIVSFLLLDKTRRGIEEIKAEEVMSKNLITVKPTTSIPGVAKIMVRKRISSLPVVDDEGKLIGIATKSDINNYFAYRGSNEYKVHRFMTPKPVTVKPSQPTFVAVYLMAEHSICRVVVVDKEKKPVGIITLSDVTMMTNLLKPAKVLAEGKPLLVKDYIMQPKSVHLLTAGDIMTAHPIVVKKDADLMTAARLMARRSISGLPVIDDNGRLVGIVTLSDITRAVANPIQ
jgi:CBS domain-containing protein